jgi:hypothetical protein
VNHLEQNHPPHDGILAAARGLIMANTTAKPNRAWTVSADTETLAQILGRECDPLMDDWFALVQKPEELMAIPMSSAEGSGYFPQLVADVIARSHMDRLGEAPFSPAASHRGDLRRKQGYSVAMLVEESRILAVCLFTTLHKNNTRLDYALLLPDVVTIAEEVDAQLKQQILNYIAANSVIAQLVH